MVKFCITVSCGLIPVASTSKTSVTLLLTTPVMCVLSTTSTTLPSTLTWGILGLAGRPV